MLKNPAMSIKHHGDKVLLIVGGGSVVELDAEYAYQLSVRLAEESMQALANVTYDIPAELLPDGVAIKG